MVASSSATDVRTAEVADWETEGESSMTYRGVMIRRVGGGGAPRSAAGSWAKARSDSAMVVTAPSSHDRPVPPTRARIRPGRLYLAHEPYPLLRTPSCGYPG